MGATEDSGIGSLKVAIAGLGTVGGGTVKLLQANAELLAKRTGRGIRITAVSDRYRRDRGFSVDEYVWYDDAVTMASEADADVVVELIGGAEGAAKQVCETAIAAGRHVVTANKALLAHHGMRLVAAFRSSSRCARGWSAIGAAGFSASSTGPATISSRRCAKRGANSQRC